MYSMTELREFATKLEAEASAEAHKFLDAIARDLGLRPSTAGVVVTEGSGDAAGLAGAATGVGLDGGGVTSVVVDATGAAALDAAAGAGEASSVTIGDGAGTGAATGVASDSAVAASDSAGDSTSAASAS